MVANVMMGLAVLLMVALFATAAGVPPIVLFPLVAVGAVAGLIALFASATYSR